MTLAVRTVFDQTLDVRAMNSQDTVLKRPVSKLISASSFSKVENGVRGGGQSDPQCQMYGTI